MRVFAAVVVAALLAVLCLGAGSPAQATTVVVSFDDLTPRVLDVADYPHVVPDGYAGMRWGPSSWNVCDDTYFHDYLARFNKDRPLTLPSPHNFVENTYGLQDAWFGWDEPVTFDGAWMSDWAYGPGACSEVRFRYDDAEGSHYTPWQAISEGPSGSGPSMVFVSANFVGVQKVYVEYGADFQPDQWPNSSWYIMDNLTYSIPDAPGVPEPGTLALLGLGLAVAGLHQRSRRRARGGTSAIG